MNVLLTFAGNRDPFNYEIIHGMDSDGPVLTLLKERAFSWTHIFTTPRTLSNANNLKNEISRRWKRVHVRLHNLEIPDPTDYESLFLSMSSRCQEIIKEHRDQNPDYFIATASGTPQMQTVWFLLAQSGMVPAKLLKITPPRFLVPKQNAVTEINLSLMDFPKISMPFPSQLDTAADCLRMEKLEAERDEIIREFSGLKMVGKSSALSGIIDTVRAVSRYDSAVLIEGETGTGKELVARAIHFNSLRKMEPLIIVNCAAIPESLVETELFGHERGAFTGAIQQKKGKFELADKGSIFLDEIGDMPLPAQSKILRVLQDKEVQRIGATRSIKVDVRIIAATNRDLVKSIDDGKFREDLYYRLKVVDIHMPALRERPEDIPLLVECFLNRHNERYNKKKKISRGAMRKIMEYEWPGNIRELENAIERAFVLSKENVIREVDLSSEVISSCKDEKKEKPISFDSRNDKPEAPWAVQVPDEGMDLASWLYNLEKTSYEKAIKKKDGNREAAARLLGIKPHTFRKRAKEKFDL